MGYFERCRESRFCPLLITIVLISITASVIARETIPIWREGAMYEVEIEHVVDRNQNEWVELEFPTGTGRLRIQPSHHYVYANDQLVGFRNRPRHLEINRAIPKSRFLPDVKPKQSKVPSEPGFVFDEPRADSRIDWDALVGRETTGGLSSAPRRNAEITNFVSTPPGFELQVLTYTKQSGSLRFNDALELTHIQLENETIPVFNRRLADSWEDSTSSSIADLVLKNADGETLKLWTTIVQSQAHDFPRVAKAFYHGTELTWLGARDPEWYFDDGTLIGVSAHSTNSILFREAIPTVSMNGEYPTEKNLNDIERKYFKGEIIHLDSLTALRTPSDRESISLRSVKREGDIYTVSFSGVVETRETPELHYNRRTRTATVSADGWQTPVRVEPF